MPKMTKTVLTVPKAAYDAANELRIALEKLNAAGGTFAQGWDPKFPYGAAERALKVTLAAFLGADDPAAANFASFVYGQCIDNGENIGYQITELLGWDLVLEPGEGDPISDKIVKPGSATPMLDPDVVLGSDVPDFD